MAGPKSNHASPIATAYARSLLELANERTQAEPIRQELGALRQIINDNKSFGLFLSDPAIGTVERGETVKKIFGGKVSPLMGSFLGVLNEKGRLGLLTQIADAYDDLLDEQLGKVEVDVTVAQKLDVKQLEQVRQRVSAALKKDAVVHQYVDESIIGGMVLRVQDKLIDASVKTQLAAMRQQLLAAAPK
jgi:F-type H+-transporting ATPase subunit delta